MASHPKFQTITSKSLTHRLTISYRVRDLTNHFFKQIPSSVNRNLINNFLLYLLSLVVILYSQILSGILVCGNRVILFVCVFFVYTLREVKYNYIIIYIYKKYLFRKKIVPSSFLSFFFFFCYSVNLLSWILKYR